MYKVYKKTTIRDAGNFVVDICCTMYWTLPMNVHADEIVKI